MTEKEIFRVIAKALEIETSDISIEKKASDFADWDSLGHLTILMEIQSTFEGQYVEDGRLATAISVKEIVTILKGE